MATRLAFLAPVLAAFILGACSNMGGVAEEPGDHERDLRATKGTLFGDITFSNRDERPDGAGSSGIGVSAFLWRAALDTLSFLPLASADPFGGVIITDWYAPPESPDERFKVTVYLLGRQLRADGVRVSVFRQARKSGSDWVDAALAGDTATRLEDTILTRARELRIARKNS